MSSDDYGFGADRFRVWEAVSLRTECMSNMDDWPETRIGRETRAARVDSFAIL